MTTWALLAPGPSASAAAAKRVLAAGLPLGAIGNAFELAPWAEFIAATDRAWWQKYPEARDLPGLKYTMHKVPGVERVQVPGYIAVNSGVLGLQCAMELGATRILLLGFDMHGSHFFGPYTNGLSNTSEARRGVHMRQYERWGKANPRVTVINCTEGSALQCFQAMSLAEALQGRCAC